MRSITYGLVSEELVDNIYDRLSNQNSVVLLGPHYAGKKTLSDKVARRASIDSYSSLAIPLGTNGERLETREQIDALIFEKVCGERPQPGYSPASSLDVI
jgi:ABC-type enterochelin transport system ATPase subunit